ncbi:MAG: DMT family transporter [Egibacteraceae bacterium]
MSRFSGAFGAAYGAVAMIVVGSSAAVLALITQYPTFGGQALRYAGAAVALLAVQYVRRLPHLPLSRSELLRLTALAAIGLAGFNVCYLQAVRHADPANVGAIIGGVPIVLAVLDPLLRSRPPSVRIVAGAVGVSVGVAITQGFSGGSLLGLLWALGALAAEVAFSLLAVPLLPRLGALRVSTYASGLAVPLLLAAGFAADGSGLLRMPTRTELLALAYLAIVVTALAFVLWYASVHRLGADRAGLCAGLAPASAVMAAAVLGTGRPTTANVLGALLVSASVVVGLAPAPDAPDATAPGAPAAGPPLGGGATAAPPSDEIPDAAMTAGPQPRS